MTLTAVLLGAVTVGGMSLANAMSPGGGVLADTADFRPAMLVVTTTPSTGANALSGDVTGNDHRHTTAATTTTTTPRPTTTTRPPVTTTTTTPQPTTTRPAPPAGQTDQVFELVNEQRAANGCAALTDDPRLDSAAQAHSDDMAANHYFDHTTPAGVTFDQREKAAGYPSPGGENIAQGQTSAQQVMTDWLNSPGHRANILNCRFTAIGVGLDTDGWYWTQDFGY